MRVRGERQTDTASAVSAKATIWVLLAVGLLIFLRAPNLFLDPRFWAEEAFVYFAKAQQSSALEAVFARHMGYFSFFANIGGLVASYVPMERAPYVTLIMSFGAQLLPVSLIMSAVLLIARSLIGRIQIITAELQGSTLQNLPQPVQTGLTCSRTLKQDRPAQQAAQNEHKERKKPGYTRAKTPSRYHR